MSEQKNETLINLGFNYDPAVFEQFIKDLNELRHSSEKSTEGISSLANMFGRFKTLAVGAIGAVVSSMAAISFYGVSKEIENLGQKVKFVFGDISDEVRKMAEDLGNRIFLSTSDVLEHQSRIQRKLVSSGWSRQGALRESARLLEGARAVSAAAGEELEPVLRMFETFVSSGGSNAEEFAEFFQRDKFTEKISADYRTKLNEIARNPQLAGTKQAAAVLEGVISGFIADWRAGKNQTLAVKDDRLSAAVEDLVNKIGKDLLPVFHKSLDNLIKVAEFFESNYGKFSEGVKGFFSKTKGFFSKTIEKAKDIDAEELFSDSLATTHPKLWMLKEGIKWLLGGGKDKADQKTSMNTISPVSNMQSKKDQKVTYNNVFNIKSNDPKEAGREVARQLEAYENKKNNELAGLVNLNKSPYAEVIG